MLPECVLQRYEELPGEVVCVELEKERQGLGLSLAGNRDRSRLSIFIVGLHPGGAAARDGRIRVGDELLEINSQVLYGRSHQNASAIIKSSAPKVKLLLLRNEDAVNQMAVAPFPSPPPSLNTPEADSPDSVSTAPPDTQGPPTGETQRVVELSQQNSSTSVSTAGTGTRTITSSSDSRSVKENQTASTTKKEKVPDPPVSAPPVLLDQQQTQPPVQYFLVRRP
ncbi:hypothetical protein CRUP_030685 [Coryphaenoides rupestris]|nr:hypothetical protein CRUP_030685 [Coryphaenoides rupestris]